MAIQGKLLFALITALTCNSFLLIGYDNGVFGGINNQPAFLNTYYYLTPVILGTITGIYDVGCFFGAILTSFIGERLGRKKSIFIGGITMLIGAILQATSYSLAQIVIARVVSGLGMGVINSTAPVYQAEFSPKASRGLYACMQLSTLNFGIFLSYWIDYAFAGIPESYAWRVPVALQCIFIIPIIVLAAILPDTPRWLIAHDRADEALIIFQRIQHGRMSPEETHRTFEHARNAIAVEEQVQAHGFMSVFKSDSIKSRRRLLIACSVQFFQQLGGINGIIYYSGTIFSDSLGFTNATAALISGLLFTWFFVASFIPWALIDRIGRRPLLIYSVSFMAAIFAVMAGLVSQIQYQTAIQHACGAAAAAMLFAYMGAFTIGFQATVWVYPPEILPLRLRQSGTAIATASNWIINYMVVQVTPVGIASIGWRYYIIYAVFNACFVPIMYFFYPETKGLELEDIDQLFADGETTQLMGETASAKESWDHVESVKPNKDIESSSEK